MKMLFFGIICSLSVVLFAEDVKQQLLSIIRDAEFDFRNSPTGPLEMFNLSSANLRKFRSTDEACDCGPGTVTCMKYNRGKLCQCENKLYVIGGECSDCTTLCSNSICDFRIGGTCTCLKDYAKNGNECSLCDCGKASCSFDSGFKFCDCDGYLSVNSKCEECVCNSHEFCYFMEEITQCDCLEGEDQDPRCASCDCFSEERENCLFVDKKQNCHCIPSLATTVDGKCVACNCSGSHYNCSLVDGQPMCLCREGYIKVNDTCEECYCGDGHSCDLTGGSKTCICKENHLSHNGTCHECNCNENEMCEIKNGTIVCVCKENFKEDNNGICHECFCGFGHDCEWIGGIVGNRLCICKDKFHVNNGICEECDCGDGHLCEFVQGKKTCQCTEGFADNNGSCADCFCGEDVPCYYENGEKVCVCNEGFVMGQGQCHEICNETSCINGICRGSGYMRHCSCNEGFSGDKCETEVSTQTQRVTIVISTLSVITVLCIVFVIIFIIRKKRRLIHYDKADFQKQTEEIYENSAVYLQGETAM